MSPGRRVMRPGTLGNLDCVDGLCLPPAAPLWTTTRLVAHRWTTTSLSDRDTLALVGNLSVVACSGKILISLVTPTTTSHQGGLLT